MFSNSTKDFFLSFGIMLLGVGLLFVGSVSFVPTPSTANTAVASLPQSAPRQTLLVGGDITPAVLPVSHPLVPLAKSDKTDFDLPLTAVAAIVVDNRTDTELFSQNANVVRPLASITKLMSALVILDQDINWQSIVTIESDDDIGSSHLVEVGEEYRAEDLWHVALIGSSNTAINALVRLTGKTRSEFVVLMNKKSADERLRSLHFSEPTGLDSGNVGNAHDVARLLKLALAQDKIFNTLKIGEYYSHPLGAPKPHRIWSTDWLLLGWIPNNFGNDDVVGKTGYITDSNYNFTVKVSRGNDRAVRAVILGAQNNEARFTEARDLANWAFDNYLWPGDSGYDDLTG